MTLPETPPFRPVSAAPSHGPEPRLAPHRISHRHPARLLRLPLKGGVVAFYWKPCAGLKHSPLEGESVRQGLRPQSNRWGGRNRRGRQKGESARSRTGGGRANGSLPKGVRRLSEKWPAGWSHHRTIRKAPPGSAGVPPACTAVAHRSVSPRCGTPPPCRRERHGLGRGRVPAPLPVEPGGGDKRGCARSCAGGTPALPGGLHPLTRWEQRRSIGLCVWSRFLFSNRRQFLPRTIRTAGRVRG